VQEPVWVVGKREKSLATAGNRIPDRATLNIDRAKSIPSRTIKYTYYIYILLLFCYCFDKCGRVKQPVSFFNTDTI